MSIEKCVECEGTGEVWARGFCNWNPYSNGNTTCTECFGTGKIENDDDIEELRQEKIKEDFWVDEEIEREED